MKQPSDYAQKISADQIIEDFLKFLESQRVQKFIEETNEAHSAMVNDAFVRTLLASGYKIQDIR